MNNSEDGQEFMEILLAASKMNGKDISDDKKPTPDHIEASRSYLDSRSIEHDFHGDDGKDKNRQESMKKLFIVSHIPHNQEK